MHEIAFKRGRRRAVCRPDPSLSAAPSRVQWHMMICSHIMKLISSNCKKSAEDGQGGPRRGLPHKILANLFGSRLGINSKSATTRAHDCHSQGKCSKSILQFHFPWLTADCRPMSNVLRPVRSSVHPPQPRSLGFCAIYLI